MADAQLETMVAGCGLRVAGAVFAAACLCLPVSPAMAGEQLPGPVPGIVERVIDGDTLAVRVRIWLGQQVRVHVRLAGIDAPEMTGRCAQERAMANIAQRFAEDFIATSAGAAAPSASLAAPQIWLSDISEGKYAGRILARVANAAGEDLGNAMLGAGIARPYAGGVRQNWCAVRTDRSSGGG